jgi:hypothetical protein
MGLLLYCSLAQVCSCSRSAAWLSACVSTIARIAKHPAGHVCYSQGTPMSSSTAAPVTEGMCVVSCFCVALCFCREVSWPAVASCVRCCSTAAAASSTLQHCRCLWWLLRVLRCAYHAGKTADPCGGYHVRPLCRWENVAMLEGAIGSCKDQKHGHVASAVLQCSDISQ